MRIIELNKTRCSVKENNYACPFAWSFGFKGGACFLFEKTREVYWWKGTPKRLAACRREFPDNVIEIRAGKNKP